MRSDWSVSEKNTNGVLYNASGFNTKQARYQRIQFTSTHLLERFLPVTSCALGCSERYRG